MKRWTLLMTLAVALVGVGCVPPPGGTNGPPPAPSGLTAGPGGGSGEVVVTWDPLPAMDDVVAYHVYEVKLPGQLWHLAMVTDDALGALEPGRLGIVDAPDFWPWPTARPTTSPRCYVLTAVSASGLQGAMSPQVCGSPP
jgi:hypothetical protein